MELKLPDLGESIEDAEVLKVLVREGDTVEADQPLLELETDKATFELPCPRAGTVTAIHVKKGDTIRVGQTVLTLGDAPKQEKDGQQERRVKPERKAGAAAKKERSEAGGAKEAEAGEAEEPEEADSAAPPRARTREKPGKDGESSEEQAEDSDASVTETDEAVAAGPATRRLARERGVDLARIQGTGSGGRITIEDVETFVRGRAVAGRAAAPAPAPASDAEGWGPVERRALTGIEKAAARHLSASWSEIPHVTHHDLADVTELEAARVRYEAERTQTQPKLTWTALVVKAVVAALKTFPRVNSSLDVAREELVIKRYIHVGVAVDTEHGLLVPVLRDADRKTTREIAAEIASLAERARERKLGRDEMRGASFTVTNLGGIGGVAFTPIVSRPEVAILGTARTREEPALRAGQLVPRVVLPLSLSYDHRVINGADAARFVRYLADLLEDPLHLLLES